MHNCHAQCHGAQTNPQAITLQVLCLSIRMADIQIDKEK